MHSLLLRVTVFLCHFLFEAYSVTWNINAKSGDLKYIVEISLFAVSTDVWFVLKWPKVISECAERLWFPPPPSLLTLNALAETPLLCESCFFFFFWKLRLVWWKFLLWLIYLINSYTFKIPFNLIFVDCTTGWENQFSAVQLNAYEWCWYDRHLLERKLRAHRIYECRCLQWAKDLYLES